MISGLLLVLVYRARGGIPFSGMFLSFGGFIVACGLGHFTHVLVLWRGETWPVFAVVQLATVAASVTTAAALPPLLPRVLGLIADARSADSYRQALERTNADLADQIAERERVELALRESEARFRSAFDHAAIGMAVVGLDGRWIEVNPAFCAIVGYGEEELLAQTFHAITYPDDLAAELAQVGNLLADTIASYHLEKRYVHKDGRPIWVMLSGALVRDDLGVPRYFLAQIQDIDTRKQAEEAQRDSERRFRAIFDQTFQFIGLLTPDGTILEANQTALDFCGFARGELIGRSFWEIPVWSDLPATRERLMAAVVEAAAGTFVRFEIDIRGAGNANATIDLSLKPIRDDAGRVVLLIPEGRDITEQKRAALALQHAAAELERSNRELAQFAAIASHDLQEPLRKIRVFGDRLVEKHAAALPDAGRDYLARMLGAAARMQQLIQALLVLSRVAIGAEPTLPADLDAVARAVLDDLETRLESTGGRVELGPLPTIQGDPMQMRQLLQNLIANALKFCRPGVPPVVRVAARDAGAGTIALIVEDNGIGFAPQYAERIFNAFERLHGPGDYEGSGIGLAVCRKIVERHGGQIAAMGRPDGGATFTITLPRAQAGIAEPALVLPALRSALPAAL